MRIEDVHISGFGHFAGRHFGPLDAPVTVFHGPNEAGKSTMLAFLRTALFGFPQRDRGRYPALNGGDHGGRLVLLDDSGRRFSLEVRERSLTLRDDHGQLLDQSSLDRLLGHASRGMFENVFAFSLDELQEFNSLGSDDAARRIYAAGMGAARLPNALAAFAKEREEIFKQSGQKQRLAAVLRDLEAIESQLRQCETDAARFAALTAQRQGAEHELAIQAERRRVLATELAAAERLARAHGDWLHLRNLRQRLNSLPDTAGFPEDGTARLERTEEALANARTAHADAVAAVERLRARAATAVPDGALLADAVTVDQARAGATTLANALRDIPKREKETADERADILRDVRDIDPRWDIAALEAFELSTATRDLVETFDRRFDRLAADQRDAESALKQARTAVSEAESAEARAMAQLDEALRPEFDEGGLEARAGAVRKARTRLAELALARNHREDVEFQAASAPAPTTVAAPGRNTPVIVILATLSFAALLAFVGLTLPGVALLLAGAGVAAWLRFTRPVAARSTPSGSSEPFGHRLAELRATEAAAARAVAESAAALDMPALDAETLDSIDTDLRRAADAITRWRALVAAHETAAAQLSAAVRRLGDASAQAGALAASDAALRSEWAAWLTSRGLAASLSPATTTVVFGKVETARVRLAHLLAEERRIGRIRDDIAEHAGRIRTLAERHGFGPVNDDASLIACGREIVARFDAATEARAARRHDASAADEADATCQSTARRVADAEAALDALLKAGSSPGPEAFRTRANIDAERRTLSRETRDVEARLRALAPEPDAYAALDAALEQSTPDDLAAHIARSQAGIEQVDAHISAVQEGLGSTRNELKHITDDSAASLLHARRAELIEAVHGLAREWSRITIAERILERARDQYQQQRQPAVLANAQEFFHTVTGGRYDRVFVPLGEKRISVRTTDGAVKSPNELSRGTVEQLYLALRFGLIRQFNEQETCLPIVVDDILVNFDPDRAARTAQAFVELSRTNQVLVFTCQPATVALFRAASKAVSVVELSDRGAPTTARLL